MSKRRSVIIMLIVFLAIGFATVSTTLVLNGILAIGENKDDFNIIFTSAKIDGRKRNDFISPDKKHIEFVSNELKSLDDKAELVYEITNTSRNYDADVQVTCSAGSTELITFEYTPHQMEVLAGETKTGTFTASMMQVVDEPTDVQIECTLTATAKERTDLGEEYIPPFSRSGVMKRQSSNDKFWNYKSNIIRVIFEDKLVEHDTTTDLTFDVSDKQDGSVMAYLVPNGENLTTNKDADNKALEDTTAYTLYIQGDTGVIANPNSSSLFLRFNNLLEVTNLKYFDTSSVTNMSYIFDFCQNLSNIDLSNFDTSNVTNMSYMFRNCNNLTSLDVSNFNTSNVTDMSGMFQLCSKLTSLDLSGFNTSKVTNTSYMFSSCNSLTSLEVSSFNTSNVTKMAGMFQLCSKLTSLDLSGFNTSKVTYMYGMFSDCSNITTLDVSNFDTSNVTNMSYMFYYCNNLSGIDVSSFDTSNVTNMYRMFSSCKNLTSLDLSNFNTSNVTNMSDMFYYCNNLTSLDVSSFDTSNITDMSHMFYCCNNLTSLDVSSFDTSNVTNMDGMFRDCNKLVTLDLSSFNTAKVTRIGYTYATSGMFYNCSSLIDLDISNFTFDSIIDTINAFYFMPSTAKIKVKDEVAQNWILALSDTDRPSSWTTENVIIKETV